DEPSSASSTYAAAELPGAFTTVPLGRPSENPAGAPAVRLSRNIAFDWPAGTVNASGAPVKLCVLFASKSAHLVKVKPFTSSLRNTAANGPTLTPSSENAGIFPVNCT